MRASSMSPQSISILDGAGQTVTRGTLNIMLRTLRTDDPIEPGFYVARFDTGARWRVALRPTKRATEFTISSLEPPPG